MSVKFPLKTDYVDDVLNTDVNTNRKFRMINNGDGTVSFEDVTEYLVEGDGYGKNQINEQNEAINELNNDLSGFYDLEVFETQVAVPATTQTSDKSPFNYTGVSSSPAVGDGYVVASATPILPDNTDLWLVVAEIQPDKRIRVYANGSTNFVVRVTYRKDLI